MEKTEKKRSFAEVDPETESDENSTTEERAVGGGGSRAKSRVVGWPPVCSYRQRSCNIGGNLGEKKCGNEGEMVKKTYVKVGMDGAPFLRKVDLNAYGSYSDLSDALKKLFGCFGVGNLNGYESGNSEYVTIYEDKEGDWMLVGDVPWVMFTESCKRLRIMKASDAKDFKRQVRNLEAHFQGLAKREITQVDHGV